MKAASLVVCALLARADAPVVDDGYSADRAVRRAIEESPLLDSLAHRIDEEEGPRTLGLLFENPELRIASRHLERTVRPTSTVADVLENSSVGVRVPVPSIKAMGFEQSVRARHVDATRADLDEARRELAARVRVLHATLLNLDERLVVVDAQIVLGQRTAELVAKRIEVGVATRFDESISALDQAAVQTEKESLLAERRLAEAELRGLLALTAEDAFALVADAKSPCESVKELHIDGAPVEEAGQGALLAIDLPRSAPALDALDARISEEENARVAAVVDLIPWVRFFELEYRLGTERIDDSVRFQMGVPLPLVNFNQDDVREHTARIARLEAERRHEVSLIGGELRAHRENLMGQHALLSLYRGTTEPVIAQSLSLVDEALALGEGDPVQMTYVTARALKAKKNALETQLRCDEAAIAWLARSGRDPVLAGGDGRTGL